MPTAEVTTSWSPSICRACQSKTIDVTVENQVLTVEGERRFTQHEGDQFVVAERPHGRFSRQLRLGSTIDTEAIGASYEDGVLTLTLPVSERAKYCRSRVGAAVNRSVKQPDRTRRRIRAELRARRLGARLAFGHSAS